MSKQYWIRIEAGFYEYDSDGNKINEELLTIPTDVRTPYGKNIFCRFQFKSGHKDSKALAKKMYKEFTQKYREMAEKLFYKEKTQQ